MKRMLNAEYVEEYALPTMIYFIWKPEKNMLQIRRLSVKFILNFHLENLENMNWILKTLMNITIIY